ncbi:MAG: glycoside hydrolase family 3 C-terminal domain-containing protein [Bacillales bacterium]|nr:glycoside hydrolase family 3 C-terminal domain-containing protein [Bacillales bacterium]
MKKSKKNIFRGVASVSCALLAITTIGQIIAKENAAFMDLAFNTSSTKVVEIEGSGSVDKFNFKSKYNTPVELANADMAYGEKVTAEGAVLLKNKNNALPLKADEKKVTLVGKIAYSSILGGQMGSGAANVTIPGRETANLVNSLEKNGFTINPVMSEAYKVDDGKYRAASKISGGFGMINEADVAKYKFDINEVGLGELESVSPGVTTTNFGEYKTSLVVLGRINSEGRDYLPGEAGVANIGVGEKNEGAKDPLGLSNRERDMINMAKTQGDKVVVLINSNSPMEIDELKNDEGIDAILWIGTTGTYGMNAVPKILDGTVNPSGKLPDTYAADISVSPAAQNWGIFSYANLDEIATTEADKITNNQEGWTAVSADNLRASAYTVYQEGIYTGYKYYETRYFDTVVNPSSNASSAKGAKEGATSWVYGNEVSYTFGYGQSYTTFEQKLKSIDFNTSDKTVTAVVDVKNTGSVAGKDAIELYVSLPRKANDTIEKAAIQLIDYHKTGVIAPNETKTYTITADLSDCTSYDNTLEHDGVVGGYVLAEGDYYFSIGNGAHEAVNNVLAKMGKTKSNGMDADGNAANAIVKTYNSSNSSLFGRSKGGNVLIQNQLDNADLNYYQPNAVKYLSRNDWAGTYPSRQIVTPNAEMIKELRNKKHVVQKDDVVETVWGSKETSYTLADMKGADWDDPRWDDFVNQITLDNAVKIIAIGGNTTWTIDEIANPRNRQADGPNGFSSFGINQGYAILDNSPYKLQEADKETWEGYKASAPNAPLIAATFDKEIQREMGQLIGDHSIWNGGATIWAGGANLHRSPYEGRTHEYFTEDPILSAYALQEMVSGGRERGCLIGPKHFAFNAIEFNRYGLSEYMTEQTARETELRSFQKAYESGECLATMTAFNRIGCSNLNAHEGLMQNILRKEWGYKGLISTDMVNGQNYFLPGECILGGVTMMANGKGAIADLKTEWVDYEATNIAKDKLLNEHLHTNMKYQWYSYANSNLLNGLDASTKVINVTPSWQIMFNVLTGTFSVTLAAGAILMSLLALKDKED